MRLFRRNITNPWAWLAGLLLAAWLGQAAYPAPALALPPADAQALWQYINESPGFRKWETFSSLRQVRRSRCSTAYGYFARVFVNDIALKAKSPPFPPGSILVREGQGMGTNTYSPNGQVTAYTVMYKVKGFNPKGGDWFWATYTGLGQARDSGAMSECLKCHGTAWQNDFVLGHDLK